MAPAVYPIQLAGGCSAGGGTDWPVAVAEKRGAPGFRRRRAEAISRLPGAGASHSALRELPSEPVSVMRLEQIQLGTFRHDAGRVDALMAAVIMFLDVAEIAQSGDAGDLVQLP